MYDIISLTVEKNTALCVFIDTTLKVDMYLYNKNDYRYHFYANINFKVSFDSQLNYVLHRDKASEHNNNDIRQKWDQLMPCVHLIVIRILILSYRKHYYINIWHLVGCCVVVGQSELHQNNCQRWSKLCPPPQFECVTHSLFALILLHNKRQMS